jgi:hypothetical protein
MGLFSCLSVRPSPRCRGTDVADDRLPALGDVDVVNGHLLLAAASVSLERVDLRRERPGELVEGGLGAVLLRDIVDVRQASGERHRGHVDRRHLSAKHRLDLIPRLDPFDDRKHEIQPALRGFGFLAGVGELTD